MKIQMFLVAAGSLLQQCLDQPSRSASSDRLEGPAVAGYGERVRY